MKDGVVVVESDSVRGVVMDVGALGVVEDVKGRGVVARAGQLALCCFLHEQRRLRKSGLCTSVKLQ